MYMMSCMNVYTTRAEGQLTIFLWIFQGRLETLQHKQKDVISRQYSLNVSIRFVLNGQ